MDEHWNVVDRVKRFGANDDGTIQEEYLFDLIYETRTTYTCNVNYAFFFIKIIIL